VCQKEWPRIINVKRLCTYIKQCTYVHIHTHTHTHTHAHTQTQTHTHFQEALEKAREAEAFASTAAAHGNNQQEQGSSETADDPSSLTKPELLERLLSLQHELASAQQERRCVVIVRYTNWLMIFWDDVSVGAL
jgi:hypothetical protein